MANMNTTFLGLELKSPIIVGSCSWTADLSKLKEIEAAGAGAVILKSIFEEQINAEVQFNLSNQEYAEEGDYLAHYVKAHTVGQYLELVKQAKQELTIPVIASINCLKEGEWLAFAKQIEEAGADAIELNMFVLPLDEFQSSQEIEDSYLRVVKQVSETIQIPIVAKISPYFTNLSIFIDKLQSSGAKGVTMFNRFYEPDINIDKMEMGVGPVFSRPEDIRNTLRWTGIIASKERMIEISTSTGVHHAEAAIKMLLAGAQTVQICSTIYLNGVKVIGEINSQIQAWMDEKKYLTIEQFRGQMSYNNVDSALRYERSQFMKYFERDEIL